ncbi:carboxylesterase/lipase family protein [Paraburkholderia unamae]|uniref:Carboxylic ester hydrolase n=1 Tax=Paraburkholderia unamae TaxID=219649 RepID=A0ABX5KBS2_9BURK|nr:carboxylesterase family protein [Paraburkholderia unamae]PVX73226.1 carboxylesterase type B [Paraburkholderia unamae]
MVFEQESRRRIDAGEVVGVRERPGIHAWRGIPFAQPPVGPLRWKAPRAPLPWQGTFEAGSHGAMPPQYADLLAGIKETQSRGQIVGDEDCLTLNVFAPAMAGDEARERRLPVMVWIYGGGMAVGSSAPYDCARNYAIHDNAVVVTFNYRLGVLGWFRHPALFDESSSGEDRSGNFGTLDVIAALRWVQRNIAVFGGDPDCVTIFGESAGGLQVLNMLASPLAAGLFHRAIAQSPAMLDATPEAATHWTDDPEPGDANSSWEVTARLLIAAGQAKDRAGAKKRIEEMGGEGLRAFLLERTARQLLEVCTPGSAGIYLGPRPIRDGQVLPKAKVVDMLRTGCWNRVPLIVGANRDEYKTFMATAPEHARMFCGVPVLRKRSAYLKEAHYMSRAWRIQGVDEVADAVLAGGHADVWTYRFDWDEYPRIPVIRPDLMLGANHGLEIAFAMRDSVGEFDLFRSATKGNRAGRERVAEAMGDFWARFSAIGEPGRAGDSGPVWSRRDAGCEAQSMVFDSPSDGGMRMESTHDSFDRLKSDLFRDSGIRSGRFRCQIYGRLFMWSPIFKGRGGREEYRRWCTEFGCTESAERFRPAREI